MNEKNVVLLGGSNSVMVNGLQKGLKEGIEKFNTTVNKEQEKLKFYNLALGASSSLQNLYELKRDRNKTILKNAELIISESNVNDSWSYNNVEIYEIVKSFFTELSYLNTKILILILPFFNYNSKTINQIHKKLALEFNFNIVDVNEYYNKNNLINFSFSREEDGSHQFDVINRQLGNNIIIWHKEFSISSKMKKSNIQFKICKAEELEILSKKNTVYYRSNSAFNEKCVRLYESDLLKFPNKYKNFKLVGFHSWTTEENINISVPSTWLERRYVTSSVSIYNKNNRISLKPCLDNIFWNTSHIYIDENTYIKIEKDYLFYCDFIAFFLASPEGNYHTEEIDFEALANENIEIPEKYNFNHLIPPVELYKEIIDEYCSIMDPRKLASLQEQISILTQEKQDLQNKFQNELDSFPVKKQYLELANLEQDLVIKKLESKKLAKSLGLKMSIINPKITFIQANSAKVRIQNHLSYKLGQALIENSKSILGYIRMPYILSYIKDKHKFEQKAYEEKIKENPNLVLPPLETYPDYNEALKEKECFTYKLGEEFIKASRNWYGGGVYQIYPQRCA